MREERQTIQSAERLTIRLFGAFSMHRGEREAPRARTRKEQSLLALLILSHASPLDRDWLAGVFWPDSEEKQALYNLRRSLSNLRQILGTDASRLSSPTPRALCFDLSGSRIDVVAFDAALTENTEASLERAVALYRAPLLEGCGESWIVPEREAREQAYLRALEILAARARERGDEATAVRHLRAAIQTDPFRETAQRSLLQALLAQDDLASATDVYRRFRLLLHRTLNTEPAPETADLAQQIKARLRSAQNGTRLARPEGERMRIPRHFPRQISSRVGRDGDIAAIQTLLRSTRLITLTGIGGIGKTRLALEVAERCAESYFDGVWFVGLSEICDSKRIVSFVSSALGLAEDQQAQQESPLDVLCRLLESKTLLLILDNCEHLIDACAPLAKTLLQRCPGLTLLATSRQSLGIEGEHLWRVMPLTVPCPQSCEGSRIDISDRVVPDPEESEAVRLFLERTRQVVHSFQITSKNRNAVSTICRMTEGIPFAIELAAAWLRALPVEQVAARMSKRLLMPAGSNRTTVQRQQTLRSMLDWSCCLLAEEEKRLLYRLSVFVGGCTLEAAEAIGSEAADEKNEANAQGEVMGLLARLVDKSLVVFSDEEDGARYHLLEMTREYAQEQLAHDEQRQARRIHADYFLHLAESTLECEDRRYLSEAWYRRIACDYENFHAALLWLATDAADPADGLRMAAALWRCWAANSRLSEGRALLERLLEKSPPIVSSASVSAARCRALYGAGVLAASQSEYAPAAARFHEALQICRELSLHQEESECLLQLGIIARDRGEIAEAHSLLEQSFAVRRTLPDPGDITPTLISLGNVACDAGDYSLASARYTESLARSQEAGQEFGIAYSQRALGGLAYHRGDYAEAERWYLRCQSLFQKLGHSWGMAYTCNRLGAIAALRGDFQEARSLIQKGLQIWEDAQDRAGVSFALSSLALTAAQEGDFNRARTLYNESLAIARELGNRSDAWQVVVRLGCDAAAEEAWERAVVLLAAAETGYRRLCLSLPHLEQHFQTQAMTRIHSVVDEVTFSLWHGRGAAFTLDEAVAYAFLY